MKKANNSSKKLITVGWSEWCALPDFKIPYIKAKIDTGAKTSALHAFDIKKFKKKNTDFVEFSIHPIQGNDELAFVKKAKIVDERYVMSSNGHKEMRYVIITTLLLSDKEWNIEVTLSNRDPLRYRLLLGREALSNNVIINPAKKCLLGNVSKREIKKAY